MTQDDISEKIIGVSYKVSNSLGSGFLEKVYENSISHELRKVEMKVEQQNILIIFILHKH